KRVIAVGRLDEQKGFDMLINAWSRIEEKVPDWKLDIFGEGPLRKQLQDQIKNLNLKNIYLKGYSVDIEKEYINSSVFVLSSRYEGFVLALMEAQAKALPCVSFDCKEGPAELIDNGINGYLIEEGNEREFSEKLLELLLDEKLRKKFSENSRKDLDRFNIEKIIEKWNRLIVTL
ncbi:MAG: glycosyltransferase, partial [Coprobacillus sp.]|nr:glycosyltransferase [Coprobacillus sp.]